MVLVAGECGTLGSLLDPGDDGCSYPVLELHAVLVGGGGGGVYSLELVVHGGGGGEETNEWL